MKKLMTLALVLALALALLAGCGGNNAPSAPPNAEDSENSDASSTSENGANSNETAVSGGGTLNLADNKNFFIIIDGVRYDPSTTIQKILDDGYALSSSFNLDKEIEGEKLGSRNIAFYWDTYPGGEHRFTVSATNRTNKTCRLAECTIYEIHVYDFTDVTLVGDLTIGSTIEEVEAVFGTDTIESSTRAERAEKLGESFGNTDYDLAMTYKKPGPSTQGQYHFTFSDDGQMMSVRMESNK